MNRVSREKRLQTCINILLEPKEEKVHKSIKHTFSELIKENYSLSYSHTNVCVLHIDTLELAEKLIKKNFNPLVLNLASWKRPGGGWTFGMGAQEESLFLKSFYYLTLNKSFYPISDDSSIYSKSVLVINDKYLNPLANRFKTSFVAVSAIQNPILIENKFTEEDRDLTRRKIETIFLTGMKYKYDTLILGALGCGVYNNPKEEIVELFNEALLKYKKYFELIVFSILGEENYSYFLEKIEK